MRNRKHYPLLITLTLLCCTTTDVHPTEPDSSDLTIEKSRDWTITIPLWVPGYRGEFAIGDVEVDGTSPGGSGFLKRMFDSRMQLNFFFMGAFSYERNRWRIHGDIFGGKFTDDIIYKRKNEVVASASLQPFIPRVHLDYRIVRTTWGDPDTQHASTWILAGARYYNVNAWAEVDSVSKKASADWVDPIIGVWIPVHLSHRWWFEVNADVGGFGVGSELSWSFYLALTYRLSKLLSLTLAYNILGVEYEGTVASEQFGWRARVAGPGAGLRFNF